MIMIIGGSGYIGQEFIKELAAKRIEYINISRNDYNYYDIKTLLSLLKAYRPKFLINAAGYTGKPNVDACELYREEAYKGNATLPDTISKACEMSKVPWGHVSSGCIYNGYNKIFTEEDVPNFSFDRMPCSYYSGTKAEGERRILDSSSSAYIWRLRIPFNHIASKRNYFQKIIDYDILLSTPNSISHIKDFVSACLSLYLKKCDYGIYNIVNTGSITAEEISLLLKKRFPKELQDKEWKFVNNIEKFYQIIKPTAPRSNCVLSNEKLLDTGIKMRTVSEAVKSTIKNYNLIQS